MSKTVLRDLDKEQLVVFDTNILLNLYFVEELDSLEIYFSRYKDNIWTPNHIFEEFTRNRKKKISEIKNRVDKFLNFETKEVTNRSLKEYKCMPTYIGDSITQKIDRYLDGIEEYIKHIKPQLLGIRTKLGNFTYEGKDEYYKIIKDNIFLNLGDAYTEDQLSNIKEIAQERFDNKIPPGYKDNNKGSNEYGDYIIWSQIINKAKEEKKNIIFVTNDEKEDWKENGEWRPELIEEFYEETNQSISLMNLSQFIEYTTYDKFSNINDLLFNLSNNKFIIKKPYDEKFLYSDCMYDILNQRRRDYEYKNCSNAKAYLELIETREFIESRVPEIYCGGIKSPLYALSMDVYIKKSNLMNILCTIHYKSDSEVLISIESANGYEIIETNDNYSKNYVKDIAESIINRAKR